MVYASVLYVKNPNIWPELLNSLICNAELWLPLLRVNIKVELAFA